MRLKNSVPPIISYFPPIISYLPPIISYQVGIYVHIYAALLGCYSLMLQQSEWCNIFTIFAM